MLSETVGGERFDLVLDILFRPGKPDHAAVEVIAKVCFPFRSTVHVERPQRLDLSAGQAPQSFGHFFRLGRPNPFLGWLDTILAPPHRAGRCPQGGRLLQAHRLHRVTFLANLPGASLAPGLHVPGEDRGCRDG